MLNRVRARIGPLWPYAVLIALPVAVFVLPDMLAGHVLMSGDNVQQNYPLHVLTGDLLRHGQLPLWNSFIFSGSPLLAGFNAGALYPLVGLFVVLPDRAAWIATDVVLFAGIGIGMYALLRALALSVVASVIAGFTFAFSGTVLSQFNHLDMTEGFVAVPWMLLAIVHIVRDGRWRWSLLLGVGFAIVVLGGAPEAMLDEAILLVAYAAISAGLDRAKWWRVLTRGGAGAALAICLSAIQWLPGLSFVASSQRSGLGGGFAAGGSYPPQDLFMALVPYLYGGYGHFGETGFFSSYNLPEVEFYLGVLPVIALLVLWIPRWPSRLAARERLSWYVVGALGLVLALGSNTPFEHLFNDLPLYGHQRLQSRNMIDVSVVACVLLAGWIDRRQAAGDRFVVVDRLLGAVPLVAVLVLAGYGLFDPAWIIHSLAGASVSASTAHAVRQSTLVAVGFCAVAWLLVWLRPLMSARRWLPLVALFALLDVGSIAATSQLIASPPNAVLAGETPTNRYVAAHLPAGGRMLLYDPQNYDHIPADGDGLPDENILAGLPSVGGYSSIVNGNYGQMTGTHTQGELNVEEFTAGSLDDLDLQDLLTLPEYFLVPLRRAPASLADVEPAIEKQHADPLLALGTIIGYEDSAYQYHPLPRPALRAGGVNSWFFGESLTASGASLLLTSPATRSVVRFGTVTRTGVLTWGPNLAVRRGTERIVGQLPAGRPAFGLAVECVAGSLPAHQAIIAADGRSYELDGSLSAAIGPDAWHQQGSVDDQSLFVRTTPPAPLRALVAPGEVTPEIEVLSSKANVETLRVVVAAPLTLVRSVATDAGWAASVSVDGRPARPLTVGAYGLVQQVHLPKGDDVVTFRYRPVHFFIASVLSGGATLLLVVVAIVAIVGARRRRGRPATPAGDGGAAGPDRDP